MERKSFKEIMEMMKPDCNSSPVFTVTEKYESFRPFVADEGGKLNPQKIDEFIKALIDAHPDAQNLSKEKRELLESFFYCVIVGPSGMHSRVNPQILEMKFRIPETFKEFLEASKDPLLNETDCLEKVRHEEYERTYIEMGSGFAFVMNCIYDAITGKTSRELYTEDELKAAAGECASLLMHDEEDVLRFWKDAMQNGLEKAEAELVTVSAEVAKETPSQEDRNENDDEDLRSPFERMNVKTIYVNGFPDEDEKEDELPLETPWEDIPINLPEPDWEAIEKEKQMYFEQCEKSLYDYVEQLPKHCRLPEEYKRLRELLHQVDTTDVATLTEEMVNVFLTSHNLTLICNQEAK